MYDWQKIITIIETIGDQEEGIASLLLYLSFFLLEFSSSHVIHFTSHPNLLKYIKRVSNCDNFRQSHSSCKQNIKLTVSLHRFWNTFHA